MNYTVVRSQNIVLQQPPDRNQKKSSSITNKTYYKLIKIAATSPNQMNQNLSAEAKAPGKPSPKSVVFL
jgi:hypothetical protein